MDFSGDELTAPKFVASNLCLVCLGCGPLPVTVASEGLVRDFLLKMVHNPGGDC